MRGPAIKRDVYETSAPGPAWHPPAEAAAAAALFIESNGNPPSRKIISCHSRLHTYTRMLYYNLWLAAAYSTRFVMLVGKKIRRTYILSFKQLCGISKRLKEDIRASESLWRRSTNENAFFIGWDYGREKIVRLIFHLLFFFSFTELNDDETFFFCSLLLFQFDCCSHSLESHLKFVEILIICLYLQLIWSFAFKLAFFQLNSSNYLWK